MEEKLPKDKLNMLFMNILRDWLFNDRNISEKITPFNKGLTVGFEKAYLSIEESGIDIEKDYRSEKLPDSLTFVTKDNSLNLYENLDYIDSVSNTKIGELDNSSEIYSYMIAFIKYLKKRILQTIL